jgi:hypothetical protein
VYFETTNEIELKLTGDRNRIKEVEKKIGESISEPTTSGVVHGENSSN